MARARWIFLKRFNETAGRHLTSDLQNKSSPRSKNIPLSISVNQNYKSCHLIPEEGRWPSSPRLGWDAVDAGGVLDEAQSAYGEVVWSWRRNAGAKLAGAIPPATVANSQFTGEITL